MNDGTDHFEERYFYPMYGSTRVVVADFDSDEDLDIAASAFFPDLESAYPESFVYLQNQNVQEVDSFSFTPFSFPSQNDGRWMLMEKADLDQDDDQDILLGSSTVLRLQAGQQFGIQWKENNLDFLILRNIH